MKIETQIKAISINKRSPQRIYYTQQYKEFLETLIQIMTIEKIKQKQNTPIQNCIVNITLQNQTIDIDNPIKAILDALEKSEIIENDKFVEEIHTKKIKTQDKVKKITIIIEKTNKKKI